MTKQLSKRSTSMVTFTDTEGYNLAEGTVKLAEVCTLQQARKDLLEEKSNDYAGLFVKLRR